MVEDGKGRHDGATVDGGHATTSTVFYRPLPSFAVMLAGEGRLDSQGLLTGGADSKFRSRAGL